MNYPVWQLEAFGGGLMIAMMAVFHVYISHFAVGGGLFLVLTELKGLRENNQSILDYAVKHTKFFLLITMVAGGITGVGIWFTIALLNPGATSVLIHNFVFAWAIEWVFFTIEIIALLIYYYTYGKMSRHNHLILGWIYFGAAWMSLFIINGVIDFMLTPGDWIQTHNFWDGYFNPTFWPALFFRTALCIIIAGLFGFMTSAWIKDKALRTTMIRYCARYLLIPFAVLLGSAWWYKSALPPQLQNLIFDRMPEMKIFIIGFLYLSPALILGGLLLAVRLPNTVTRPVAVLMLLLGFLYMGCFEFIREGGRRPYILRDYMYSSSILKTKLDTVRRDGLLSRAKWVRHHTLTPENTLEAGRDMYNILCLPCHSIGGPLNDIKKLSTPFTETGLDKLLATVEKTHPYMPPFAGTAEERLSVARYISRVLNGQLQQEQAVEITPLAPAVVPSFQKTDDAFVLLAWSDMGMRSMTDASGTWLILPPGVTIEATLIHRGETPEVVTEDVNLSYKVEASFAQPSDQLDFWANSQELYGRFIDPDTGITGTGPAGEMELEESSFKAELLPLAPYPASGGYMPYPTIAVSARDNEGNVLTATTMVAPVATELGCRTCHSGPWRVDNRAGISRQTAENVLTAHDRLSGTDLAAQAGSGKPVLCSRCHNAEGKQLNMSAAIHGFHAEFLSDQGSSACTTCHPAAQDGATRAFRGIHHSLEMECTNCHGALSDHALSLLRAEQEKGKQRADTLISLLQPQAVETVAEILPRTPWINEPDCLNCHLEFEPPEEDTTFNQWTAGENDLFRNRTDESGQLRCAGCHGSPHALYPAVNPYRRDLDVIQPLQYQGEPLPIGSNRSCTVCHTIAMDEEMHHPNMLREFRN